MIRRFIAAEVTFMQGKSKASLGAAFSSIRKTDIIYWNFLLFANQKSIFQRLHSCILRHISSLPTVELGF